MLVSCCERADLDEVVNTRCPHHVRAPWMLATPADLPYPSGTNQPHKPTDTSLTHTDQAARKIEANNMSMDWLARAFTIS